MNTIGFIGTGNMGGALAAAAARSEKEYRLLLSNRTREKAEELSSKIGGEVTDNKTIAREADYIFLGVKPQYLNDVYEQIKDVLKERNDSYVIVSMMAGKTIPVLKEMFDDHPIIRIMPNMPVTIGKGLSFVSFSDDVSEEDKKYFFELMGPSGVLKEVSENYMTCAGGISGCGPAFAAMFMEGLADGAVACGVARKDAYEFAAEMMKGTADLYLETLQHPGAIKDSVCSPAGSTIQGVRVLEERGFRAALTDALIATFEKKF